MTHPLLERLKGLRSDARVWEIAGALALAVILVVLGAVGWSAGRDRSAEAAELRELLRTTEGWSARFVAPVPAESVAWNRSVRAVTEVEFEPEARLRLLQLVSERAVAAGIPEPRITFVDHVPGGAWRSAAGWSVRPAEYGLRVGFMADYWSVVAFFGALPPMVEVRSVELARSESAVLAEVVLAVYESLVQSSESSARARTMDADAWRALEPYLAPVRRSAPVVAHEEDWGRPARDPFARAVAVRSMAPSGESPAPATGGGWTVSAIMITENRRVAVIDGRVVVPGDTIAGGARVAAVEPQHVVVRDRGGTMRQLRLSRSGET